MNCLRRLGIIPLAVVCMVGLSLHPAISHAVIPGVHYLMPSHAYNKCVTVHGWDASERAKIDQWTCLHQSNQQWNFMVNGSFGDWIKSEFSNKCLDGGKREKGWKVLQWPCHFGLEQSWRLILHSANRYEVHIGTMCLDVEGGDTANGARLILWTCNGRDNQLFRLDPPA
jgi:ricin-type beta-trefoil lectin protein